MAVMELMKSRRKIADWTSEELDEYLSRVPVVEPEPDEIEAFRESYLSDDIGVPFECINWR